MKDKKQSSFENTVGALRFVASAPIDDVRSHLSSSPIIKSRIILNLNHRIDYRIRLDEAKFSEPIFLSMTQWNQDETLIILSYYIPSRIKIFAMLFLIASLILSILAISPIIFFFIWLAFLGIAIFNRSNSIGTLGKYKSGKNKRTQDDTMDSIIDNFKEKFDLIIVS